MLTSRQRDLLVFINDRLTETGVCPSFLEMQEAMGLSSKSGIHRMVSELEERGFIRRLHFRARAIEVLRLPANMEPPVHAPVVARGRPGWAP